MKGKKVLKRFAAVGLAAFVAVGMVPVTGVVSGGLTYTAEAKEVSYGLSNPRVSDFVNDDGKNDVQSTWDCIWFGSYPQSDSTGTTKDPIKWRVLSVNGDDAFILADQNLNVQPYNTEWKDVTWETCTLRTWLNNDFYEAAFDDTEKSAIKTTTVVNDDNSYYGTDGGNNTSDKIYLLSLADVTNREYGFPNEYGFSYTISGSLGSGSVVINPSGSSYTVNMYYLSSETRQSRNTQYVAGSSGTGRWWLRSPGDSLSDVASVDGTGAVNCSGDKVQYGSRAVRPAMHIDLSSSVWTYAGTVSSDEIFDDATQAENDSDYFILEKDNNSFKHAISAGAHS